MTEICLFCRANQHCCCQGVLATGLSCSCRESICAESLAPVCGKHRKPESARQRSKS